VRSISVDGGSARGGTRLVVDGSGFTTGAQLTVGVHVARIVALTARTIVAVTPPGLGTQEVRVTTDGGTSSTTSHTQFRYRATVLVIGDSLGIDLGWGFASPPSIAGSLSVSDDSVGSTGLVRSDFYDWPAHLRTDLRRLHPDVVVVLFGANDEQAIRTPHGLLEVGTAAWATAYEQRIRVLAAVVRAGGATLLWVELPRMAPDSDLSGSFVAEVDRLELRAISPSRTAACVRTAALFTTRSGRFTPEVVLGHVVEDGRQPDGVHLTPAGATAIADLVVAAMHRID
jgi:hypothetical protein